MKKIVAGFVTLTVAAWLLNLAVNPPAVNVKALVHETLYLSGLLAWGFATMAVVIAARPAWLEGITGTPLDKLYKWHKTLGIAAAVLTVLHFFSKDIFGPLVRLITTAPSPKPAAAELTGFAAFWADLRGFAETSAEIAVYAGLVLLAVTFLSRLRYSGWLSTHRLFSVIYLVLAVHAVRLTDAADWATPFGFINAAVTLTGVWYSIELLVFGAGRAKSVAGSVTRVGHHEGLSEITVLPARPMTVHRGQFAFLRTKGHEKHPFSIASVNDDGSVTFVVKGLGDYTREAVPAIRVGESVILEGPWGDFRPDFSKDEQLWLAGGAGIAPFCAWLQEAARHAHGAIRLVWCIRSRETEPMLENVRRLAREAGVTLEVVESQKRRLDVGRLFAGAVPQTLALCAGTGLSAAVSKAYVAAGGSERGIRREHFDWR